MKKRNQILLLSSVVLLLTAGLILGYAGIFHVDAGAHHSENRAVLFDAGLYDLSGNAAGGSVAAAAQVRSNPMAEKGITVGELMRLIGILSIVIAIMILCYVEFFYKARIRRLTYRLLLILSLFILPVIATLGATATVLETTKTVESCASCHVMEPFVNDLFHQESTSLAARHYKNGWISEYQCYTCHTTYGAHGTFEGKRDGFRHWLLYVTETWAEPIVYSGSYPNVNCTSCHVGTEKYRQVASHRALSQKLQRDEVSCTSCHGPAHPTPAERDDVPERAPLTGGESSHIQDKTVRSISFAELGRIIEHVHGKEYTHEHTN